MDEAKARYVNVEDFRREGMNDAEAINAALNSLGAEGGAVILDARRYSLGMEQIGRPQPLKRGCEHAMALQPCPCPEDCYCKADTCAPPDEKREG